MNKWKSAVHGGMCIVMFANHSVALAQQAVSVGDGKDVTLGSKADAACASASSTCTVNAVAKAQLSAILGPIPQQVATTPIGGVGVLVNTNNVTSWLHVCGSYTTLSMAVASTLQIIAAGASKTIYVCDFDISNQTSASTSTLSFVIGTGTNCANGSSQLGQAWYVTGAWGKIAANPFYRGMSSGAVASSALCVKSSATTTVDVGVYYDQY